MRYIKIDGVPNFYENADFGDINAFRELPLSSLPNLRYTISYGTLLQVVINDIKTVVISHEASLKSNLKKEIKMAKKNIHLEESKLIRDENAIF